ncbi:putative bifunctional diguanylate cyclase/phosphodiesterase [Teichococcus wenyumeiae]|nr:EAL domain-containing protein [Pseudoroseomonas wenyumeiae]
MSFLLQRLRQHSVLAEARAELLRQRLAVVLESVPGAFALCDAQGRLQLANSRFRRLFEHVGLGASLGALLPSGMGEQGAFDHGLKDGSWHRVTRQPLPDGGFTLGAVDITPLKRQEQILAARNVRQQALLELVPTGIWELDEAGRTVFANRQLANLLGGTAPPGLAEAGLRRVTAPGRPPADPMRSLPAPGMPVEVEHQGGGIARRLLLVASGLLEATETAIDEDMLRRTRLVTLLDITERRLAQAEVERLAWQDPLTGLGNRARFIATLSERVADGTGGLTLLSISLGGLGQVNERHGHTVGDAVLRAAALRLSQGVRVEDAVFRIGGNKFAVLAPAMEQQTIRWLCDRLAQVLFDSFRQGALEVALLPAIGVATAPQIRGGAETLRRAADLARHRSEVEGRTPVFYEEALGAAADRRQKLRKALAQAIPAGELHLVWQPLFDTRRYRMIGAEALLRWRCGAVSREVMPAELFPLATEMGMLAEIDFWVLWEALATKRRWAGKPGAPPTVAINISGATLRDPGFPAQVSKALEQHGVAAEELDIEIPEDIPARDIQAMAQNLEALRSMGVRLSLDDFGGGVSAMAHLVQLPVQRVKLDRSITHRLPEGKRETAVLGAVATLANSLGIELVAEGVEKEVQASALRAEGCFIMQGWLYGRPLAADLLVPPGG